jgi:fatty-acyl-CoA synthase
MHTLNLRLSPDEIGWIAGDAQDRFLVVDDVLLPLYSSSPACTLREGDRVPVLRRAGAPEFADYERCSRRRPGRLRLRGARRERPGRHVLHVGTTGRPKGVVYSHRSTVLHTLVASLGDFWGLRGTDVVLPVTPMFHANSWGMPMAP